MPQRRSTRMRCGDHFRKDPILQQPADGSEFPIYEEPAPLAPSALTGCTPLPRGGTSRIAAHRVGELTRALFLTLDGQILLRHRGANEAPSKPRRWWGQPGVAGGRWQLR
jgi:hypothetical protein